VQKVKNTDNIDGARIGLAMGVISA